MLGDPGKVWGAEAVFWVGGPRVLLRQHMDRVFPFSMQQAVDTAQGFASFACGHWDITALGHNELPLRQHWVILGGLLNLTFFSKSKK